MFSYFILFFILICYLFEISNAIVGGEFAKAPPPDDPVVFARRYGKSARILGEREDKYYAFKGLRYAQPPIGKNRFMRPITWHLEGDIDATRYGPPCLQKIPNDKNNITFRVIGNEDCLFINVFSTQLPDGNEGAPVVVWFHGGGFGQGSGSQYDVKNLTERRVVVVTFNYRLGPLGYLSYQDPNLPGNAGLFDMAMALRWIRDYIGFFGGNPRNVITMGQGSGATSASVLGFSDLIIGFQHGVVAMSGSPMSQWAIDSNSNQRSSRMAQIHKCNMGTTVGTVRCLQNVSAEEIIKSDNDIAMRINKTVADSIAGLQNAGPVVEGPNDFRSLPNIIIQEPVHQLKKGRFNKIPLLIGVTANETSGAIMDNLKDDLVKKIKSIPNFIETQFVNQLKSITDKLRLGFSNNPVLNLVENSFLDTLKQKKGQANLFDNISPIGSRSAFGNSFIKPLNEPLNLINQTVDFTSNVFKNYLKVASNNIFDSLNKISEITGDVLFNAPAFLTASLWSKNNPNTFMYQFNYKGNAAKGKSFLNGLPLAGGNKEKGVSHGDDLAYLFNPQTINGEKMHNELSKEDEHVRGMFMDMVVEFANLNQKSKKAKVQKSLLTPFNEKDNNFLIIDSKPSVSNNFRFCEIGLWGGMEDRLKSPICKFLTIFENFNVFGNNNNNKKPLDILGGPTSIFGRNSQENEQINSNQVLKSKNKNQNMKNFDFL